MYGIWPGVRVAVHTDIAAAGHAILMWTGGSVSERCICGPCWFRQPGIQLNATLDPSCIRPRRSNEERVAPASRLQGTARTNGGAGSQREDWEGGEGAEAVGGNGTLSAPSPETDDPFLSGSR